MDTKSVVALVEERRAELDLLDELIGQSETSRLFGVARESEAQKVRDSLQMLALSKSDAPRETIVGVIEKRRAELQVQLDASGPPAPVYSKHAKLQAQIDVCNDLISLVPPEKEPAAKHAR